MQHERGGYTMGVVGTGLPIFMAALTWLSTMETGLRILSLLVGLAVGLVTLWQKLKRKEPPP